MADILLDSLSFSYGKKKVFDGLSLSFDGPGLFLLTGPSGCGKTTLLRLFARLEKPSAGVLSVSDPVAFAFQEYRLFPGLSALRNVTCVRDPKTKEETAQNDAEALTLLSSLGLAKEDAMQTPDALSGGMKQRVSLARALFSPHPIKLLDEVTKELDRTSVDLVLAQIAKYSADSLILFSTPHPEDCDGIPSTRIELPPLK
ncbi:MAG: ATP-binding cassette domain-containing protein [Clostridia bacterium]|nr:ATP-binding cassette domain-containing protein [Clostridia bacterium]